MRFKEGSIPYAAGEYESLRGIEKNRQEGNFAEGRYWCDYVNGIDYNGYLLNLVEYVEEKEIQKRRKKEEKEKKQIRFLFLTDLSVTKKNAVRFVEYGRNRWKIENEGFNTQKTQGYCLEHLFSKDYQAIKNHHYLIQIGHMIAQVMENIERIWRNIKLSREQKHRRILESFKKELIGESETGLEVRMQMRLI